MDYKSIYTKDYFSGKNSFFYKLGYGNFAKYYFDSLFRQLRPYLQNQESGRVLDVGCAYGYMLQRFPDTFEKYGIDVSEYAINVAKQKLPSAKFIIQGAEDHFPLPNNFFDVVTSNDVLEHLERPEKALGNIFKVLKPGGVFCINLPNLNWIRKAFFASADKQEHHISMLTHEQLLSLLKDAGFRIVNHWTYTSLPYFFFIKFKSNLGHEQAVICTK